MPAKRFSPAKGFVSAKALAESAKGLDAVAKALDIVAKGVDAIAITLDETDKSLDVVSKGLDKAAKGLDRVAEGLDGTAKGPDGVTKSLDEVDITKIVFLLFLVLSRSLSLLSQKIKSSHYRDALAPIEAEILFLAFSARKRL